MIQEVFDGKIVPFFHESFHTSDDPGDMVSANKTS